MSIYVISGVNVATSDCDTKRLDGRVGGLAADHALGHL
jgi:hypothetical protein